MGRGSNFVNPAGRGDKDLNFVSGNDGLGDWFGSVWSVMNLRRRSKASGQAGNGYPLFGKFTLSLHCDPTISGFVSYTQTGAAP